MTTPTKRRQGKNFTALFEELEAIVAAFERGDFDVDDGLKNFERGLHIAELLQQRLAQAEQRVETLRQRFAILRETEGEQEAPDPSAE